MKNNRRYIQSYTIPCIFIYQNDRWSILIIHHVWSYSIVLPMYDLVGSLYPHSSTNGIYTKILWNIVSFSVYNNQMYLNNNAYVNNTKCLFYLLLLLFFLNQFFNAPSYSSPLSRVTVNRVYTRDTNILYCTQICLGVHSPWAWVQN